MMKTIKYYFKQFIDYLQVSYFREFIYKRDKFIISEHSLPKLSKNEWTTIKQVWPNFKLKEKDLVYMKLYKKEYSFDPYFICDYSLYLILKKTNPANQVVALQHKGLIDIWFPKIKFPTIYIRSIAGIIYDDQMNIINLSDAISKIISTESFIIKPTIETAGGKGVKKIFPKNISNEELKKIILSYKKDFVIQEVIKQRREIEVLNPTSLNTCRVTSIYINGKWDCSTMLKVGKKNADKDNWSSSYLIGINKDGTLKECGYDNKLRKVYKTDLGYEFKGLKLPLYEKMLSFVKEKHIEYFPHCGIIGWDILIDDCDEIRVIEINLDFPGILGEQMVSGTFFKNFRDDIIKLELNN